MQPVLHGTATTLRPTHSGDVERLTAILAKPDVRRWWPGYDIERVRSELLGHCDAVVFAIEVDGHDSEPVVVGSVQYVEEPASDYRHASIDVFLDPDWHGKGLGSDAVRTLARYLFHDRNHHRLAIDPAVDNVKAIACARRVGFREVGVMRQYERGESGEWGDCLLMDLLKRELH
jgi:aminoglycoside 6'-N-acetyltransferase